MYRKPYEPIRHIPKLALVVKVQAQLFWQNDLDVCDNNVDGDSFAASIPEH